MHRDGQDSLRLIEIQRQAVLVVLEASFSDKTKLQSLTDYFRNILALPNKSLREAYITEFIETFINLLSTYNPFYISTETTKIIINVTRELIQSEIVANYFSVLENTLEVLTSKFDKLINILEGKIESTYENKIYFPVLEQVDPNTQFNITGFLETVSIQIRKTEGQNKFRLIPGEVNKDKLIEDQLLFSWTKALEKVKPFIRKIDKHHEVFVHFDTATGYYRGNSLGSALTLLFIDRLLKYYNSPTLIATSGKITFTGGIDEDGKVLNTSHGIIKRKVEIVFYSDAKLFCVPRDEESVAQQALKLLNEKYPRRELKIIGVESLDDILDRRRIVTIKKFNPVRRSGKFVLRNWFNTILILLLGILIYAAGFWDFDDNPAYCEQSGKTIIARNKNGTQLWTKNTRSPDDPSSPLIRVIQKVIDIDYDNKNEVIISFGLENLSTNAMTVDSVSCFDSKGELLWQYLFEDTIETHEGKFSNPYAVFILGSYNKNGHKIILLSARNHFYPTAVFQLDAKTGKRIGTTLWHAGHINSGLVGDFNKDGVEELVAAALNNCYESVAIFSINLNNLSGYAPAENDYKFVNQKIADLNKYHLIEKTDFTNYFKIRFNNFYPGGLVFNRNSGKFILTVLEGTYLQANGVSYFFSTDLEPITIDPSDELQVQRDSLISKGLIVGPFTKSSEYKKILWGNIKT